MVLESNGGRETHRLSDGDREERDASRLHSKMLERWCDSVRVSAENMLSSSLNTPGSAALLSSEVSSVMTLPAHSATVTESLSDNDSEIDGEEQDDVSDNDFEILGEQSGTVDVTNSTDSASGGT